MPPVICLSSSPVRVFARSPTGIELSSPPLSPKHATDGKYKTSKLFQPSSILRDDFSNSFTTARQVLGPKTGAENVPVYSPSKTTIRATSTNRDSGMDGQTSKLVEPSPACAEVRITTGAKADWEDVPDCAIVKILPSDLKRNRKPPKKAALNIKKAPARRTDWTPPRYATTWDESPDLIQANFGTKLVQFGHVEEDSSFERTANTKDGELTKRRRIDLVRMISDVPVLKPTTSTVVANKTSRPRSKSPAKKSLTITGLATSHYFGEEQGKTTPMMQYLVSTQAKLADEEGSGTFETKIRKKAVVKPKKSQLKSRLRSPETALKTFESQEVIFASASQLARDESPTILRDTIEAIKQSEECQTSDPVSPQRTAPASIESATPRTGPSRFRGCRRLWSAADRDDENALLHMDDALDTPIFRDSFAGKDALIERTVTKPSPFRLSGTSGRSNLSRHDSTIFDIDDVTTPTLITSHTAFPAITKRTYSTVSKSPGSKRTKDFPQVQEKSDMLDIDTSDITKSMDLSGKKLLPPKPDYKTWSDEDLKKQLKGYGIKGMRKRENMIKRLNARWAEVHGVELVPTQLPPKIPQHSDILSKVHDFAARPVPKVKKQRGRKKKAEEEAPPKAKSKSKKGKTTAEADNQEAVAAEPVVDIDDTEEPTVSKNVSSLRVFADDDFLEPSTAPTKGTGVKAVIAKKRTSKPKSTSRPLTPPPTIPAKEIPASSPGFEEIATDNASEISSPDPPPPSSNSSSTIKSKILAALKYDNPKDKARNHQTNPTWYEKIQMYDPIVLEDFTAWLNTEGFNAVGEDGEIDVNEIKAWCEEVGVCCLWKGGWRGNKKSTSKDVVVEEGDE